MRSHGPSIRDGSMCCRPLIRFERPTGGSTLSRSSTLQADSSRCGNASRTICSNSPSCPRWAIGPQGRQIRRSSRTQAISASRPSEPRSRRRGLNSSKRPLSVDERSPEGPLQACLSLECDRAHSRGARPDLIKISIRRELGQAGDWPATTVVLPAEFPALEIRGAQRCYSSRSTLIGSSLDALQAGRNPAIVATPRSTSAITRKAPN